jgi:hypothetical protein
VASVPAGSANYIQNTSNPQSNANFNISGNGFIGGNVGIGTNSPVTKLEVVHPVTQIRFGPSTADNGGYLISTHGSQAIIAGGARWNSGQWIARAGSASLIALGSGVIQFTTNGGLTEDTAFTPTERMRVDVSGFVGIGTDQPTARLHVRQLVFDTALRIETGGTNDFISGVVGDSQKFHIDKNGAYVTGSDFAEALPYTGNKADYEPGDVLVLSAASAGAIEKSDRAYDVHVTGIYSTRPGVLGAEKGGNSRVDPNDLPVAILGIVPAKVSAENGPIRIGDLLTTSTTPGHAMRCDEPLKCIGAIVGKALEPMEKGKGIIKVLVMLR